MRLLVSIYAAAGLSVWPYTMNKFLGLIKNIYTHTCTAVFAARAFIPYGFSLYGSLSHKKINVSLKEKATHICGCLSFFKKVKGMRE